MTEQQDPQDDQLSPGDSAVVDSALMPPDEWNEYWLNRALATGENVVDPAIAQKAAAKLGRGDEAMRLGIQAMLGPQVDVPRQPTFHDLTNSQKLAYMRRGMAARGPR